MCELDNGLDDELDGKWIWRVARFRISQEGDILGVWFPKSLVLM